MRKKIKMEQKELEYFAEWLIENHIMIVDGEKWKTSILGSKQYTTEELVRKYLNEEKL